MTRNELDSVYYQLTETLLGDASLICRPKSITITKLPWNGTHDDLDRYTLSATVRIVREVK